MGRFRLLRPVRRLRRRQYRQKLAAFQTPDDAKDSTEGAFEPIPPSLEARREADPEGNLEWNRKRWGQVAGWTEHDHFGYQWTGGYIHTSGSVARFFDENLRPYLDNRYDLDILEISPGAGRTTVEFIRYARSLAVIDMNEVPITICRERLKYYPNDVSFHVNDGRKLDCVADRQFDLIASYDSLVHVHPEIVRGYVLQSADLLKDDGVLWFDHSGKGERSTGRRSAVTAEAMAGWIEEANLILLDQVFRNSWDCISVARRPPSD